MALAFGAGAVVWSHSLAMYAMEWNARVFGRMDGAFARFITRVHTGGRQASAYWVSRVVCIFVGLVFVVVGIANLMSG